MHAETHETLRLGPQRFRVQALDSDFLFPHDNGYCHDSTFRNNAGSHPFW